MVQSACLYYEDLRVREPSYSDLQRPQRSPVSIERDPSWRGAIPVLALLIRTCATDLHLSHCSNSGGNVAQLAGPTLQFANGKAVLTQPDQLQQAEPKKARNIE